MQPDLSSKQKLTDFARPNLPPRSHLHCLDPVGVGTSEVECLTSYIVRLAESHSVSVESLCRWKILPNLLGQRVGILRQDRRVRTDAIYRSSWMLNGLNPTARAFTKALEILTLQTGLEKLTCAPWGTGVPSMFLSRKSLAWCPECYDEWREAGKGIYAPLSWTIKAVSVCVKHKRVLEFSCFACGRAPGYLAANAQSGGCSRCHKLLELRKCEDSLGINNVNEGDARYQHWAAQTIGDWIKSAQTLPSPPTRDIILKTISQCIRRLAGGSDRVFAHLIDVSEQCIYNWRAKKIVPSLDYVLKICFKLGGALASFITGESFIDEVMQRGHLDELIHYNLKKCSRRGSKIRELLARCLKEVPPPSLHNIAMRIELKSVNQLRKASPELCKKITARHRNFVKEQGHSPATRNRNLIRRALERALKENPPPPLSQLAISLNYSGGASLSKSFRDLCRAILDKREDYRKAYLAKLRLELQAAIKECPPPALRQVASRLGLTSTSRLGVAAPELCRILIERHTQWKGSQRESVLRDALLEYPPRPLSYIIAQYNYQYCVLKKSHPALCHLIVERYAAYNKESVKEKRSIFKEEIRQAALTLLAQGLHPSGKQIKRLLKASMIDHAAFARLFREVKSELKIPDWCLP